VGDKKYGEKDEEKIRVYAKDVYEELIKEN